MSRVLAIDTSGWWTGVALVEDANSRSDLPRVVAEAGVDVGDTHAGPLLRRIEWLLQEVGWDRATLDAYVACRGPGSFTGVRIGLGTIRGLGLAASRPCIGVGTLEALAEAHGPAEGVRVPIVSAGRGEVYLAAYDARSSPPRAIVDPWVGPVADALRLQTLSGECVAFGTGASEFAAASGFVGRIGRTPRGIAGAAGRLALARGLDPKAADVDMSPQYVRPPDAIVGRTR